MSQTQELRLHNVSLQMARGKDVIQVRVPEHEIPVLRVIHRNNVTDHGKTEVVDDFPVRAVDETARLQRKYRQPNAPDPVRLAYPGLTQDIARFGFEDGGVETQAPRATIKNRPRVAKRPEGEKRGRKESAAA